MTKLWRRLSSKEFRAIFHEGSFLSGRLLSINVKTSGGPAVGFTLKKKKRNAVERNFMRRRIREAFIKVQEFVPVHWQIVIIGFNEVNTAKIDVLSDELYYLLKRCKQKMKEYDENSIVSY
jgi:ribonuclease P protein component